MSGAWSAQRRHAGLRALLGVVAAILAIGAGVWAATANRSEAARTGQTILKMVVPGIACDACEGSPGETASKEDLSDLLARMPGQTYRVVYDLTFEEKESGLSGTLTVTLTYADPRLAFTFLVPEGLDLTKFDTEADADPVSEFGLFTDGGKAWLCARTVQKAGECQEFALEPTDDLADLEGLLNQFLDAGTKDQPLDAREVGSRRIADHNARCFLLTRQENADVATDVDTTLCVDESIGVPLAMEGTFDASGDLNGEVDESQPDNGVNLAHDRVIGNWTMRARSVSLVVSASDFALPFPVTSQ